jgi:CheY-like chemotaxis protein
MSAMALEEGASVLVVDDDERDAKTITRPLIDAGFRTSVISDFSPTQDADSFLSQLGDQYHALVCDHVLSGRSTVRFTGAELVSKANRRAQRPLPAVLISSHVQTDQTGSIRRWREGIPVVLEKSELSETIVEALDYTVDELSGKISRERRAFATPIEILEVLPDGEVPTAKVIVVGWRIATSVWMPLQPILEATGLEPSQLAGRWLEADVNCHAQEATDLYFRNIILAPDLPEGWR